MRRLGFGIALSLALIVVACMAMTAVIGFACLSLYFFMTTVTAPALAALTVAIAALVFAALLVMAISLIRRPRPLALLANQDDAFGRMADAMEMGKILGDEGRQFLKANLSGSAMAAFGFGIAMGVSPKLRKAVFDILRH